MPGDCKGVWRKLRQKILFIAPRKTGLTFLLFVFFFIAFFCFLPPLTFWQRQRNSERERERMCVCGAAFYYCTFAHAIIFGIYCTPFLFFWYYFFSVCTLRHYLIFIRVCAPGRPELLFGLWTRPGYGCGYVYGREEGWRKGGGAAEMGQTFWQLLHSFRAPAPTPIPDPSTAAPQAVILFA